VKERYGSIYLLSLLFALALLLVMLTDVGTGWNQLIDIVVLPGLVIGEFIGRTATDRGSLDRAAAATVSVVRDRIRVLLAEPEQHESVEHDRGLPERDRDVGVLGQDRGSLIGHTGQGVGAMRQLPVDRCLHLRCERDHETAQGHLTRRIEAQEFDLVVLVEPLEPLGRSWWREEDFGPEVVEAISEAYVFGGRTQGYCVYRPRASAEA
jgi:hypothetical protein